MQSIRLSEKWHKDLNVLMKLNSYNSEGDIFTARICIVYDK